MSDSRRIAILHPGAMGAAMAACACAAGHTVSWLADGRSDATCARAKSAGLREAGSLQALLAENEWLVSICPPAAALDVARQVADCGFDGLYLDANAIAPQTAAAVANTVRAGGARYVDGGVIGPPPLSAGTSRLYLSGPDAADMAGCFAGSALEAEVIGNDSTAASSLKMCYSAWSKGSAALLLAVCAVAENCGVRQPLTAEWQRSIPGLNERIEHNGAMLATKAWRFAPEMEEIATTFDAAGLTPDFHRGAAAVYSQLTGFRDYAGEIDPEWVVAVLSGKPLA